jgi:hypothetical protein
MVSGRPATAWGKATVCAGPPDTTFFVRILLIDHDIEG